MSFSIDWRSWLFGIEVGEGEDFWRRKCDRLRGEMDTRLREARSLPAALAVVLSHVREHAESLEPSLLAVNDRLDNGPRETGEFADSADRLVALLEALAEQEK